MRTNGLSPRRLGRKLLESRARADAKATAALAVGRAPRFSASGRLKRIWPQAMMATAIRRGPRSRHAALPEETGRHDEGIVRAVLRCARRRSVGSGLRHQRRAARPYLGPVRYVPRRLPAGSRAARAGAEKHLRPAAARRIQRALGCDSIAIEQRRRPTRTLATDQSRAGPHQGRCGQELRCGESCVEPVRRSRAKAARSLGKCTYISRLRRSNRVRRTRANRGAAAP